jgi:hypothetical protein
MITLLSASEPTGAAPLPRCPLLPLPRLPPESQLEALQVQQQRPIMYYRPEQPEGMPFLKCTLKPGGYLCCIFGGTTVSHYQVHVVNY